MSVPMPLMQAALVMEMSQSSQHHQHWLPRLLAMAQVEIPIKLPVLKISTGFRKPVLHGAATLFKPPRLMLQQLHYGLMDRDFFQLVILTLPLPDIIMGTTILFQT